MERGGGRRGRPVDGALEREGGDVVGVVAEQHVEVVPRLLVGPDAVGEGREVVAGGVARGVGARGAEVGLAGGVVAARLLLDEAELEVRAGRVGGGPQGRLHLAPRLGVVARPQREERLQEHHVGAAAERAGGVGVVVGAFVISGVIIVKMLGVAMLVALLLDATLIRGVLVPASMRLMGRWNWWLPAGLARWWERHNLAH